MCGKLVFVILWFEVYILFSLLFVFLGLYNSKKYQIKSDNFSPETEETYPEHLFEQFKQFILYQKMISMRLFQHREKNLIKQIKKLRITGLKKISQILS